MSAETTLNTPYAFQIQGQTLQKTLQTFALDHNLVLNISPKVSTAVTIGQGWIRANSGSDFLNSLAARSAINWFIFQNTLYISPANDITTKRVLNLMTSPEEARSALSAVGLFDARFGWGAMPNENAVLVSGPARYVSLVEQFLRRPAAKPVRHAPPTSMLFPVRYAAIEDRTVDACGSPSVIPGMVTLLRTLLGQDNDPSASLPPTMLSPPLPPPLNPSSLASAGIQAPGALATNPTASSALPPPPLSSEGSAKSVRIIGDVRSNSVLIHDDPAKRSSYSRLIASLDIPRPMIELEELTLEMDAFGQQQLCEKTGTCFDDWLWSEQKNTLDDSAPDTLRGSRFERVLRQLLASQPNTLATPPHIVLIARQRLITEENQLAGFAINRDLYTQPPPAGANPNLYLPAQGSPRRNDADQLCIKPGRVQNSWIKLVINMQQEGWKDLTGQGLEARSQGVLQTQLNMQNGVPVFVASSSIGARPGYTRSILLIAHILEPSPHSGDQLR